MFIPIIKTYLPLRNGNQIRIAMKDALGVAAIVGNSLVEAADDSLAMKRNDDGNAYIIKAQAWSTATSQMVKDAYGGGSRPFYG